MRTHRLGTLFASFAIVATSLQAGSTTVDIEVYATDFAGIGYGSGLTGEPPPAAEISGSFTVEADPLAPLPPGGYFHLVAPDPVDWTIAQRVYSTADTQAFVMFRPDGSVWELGVGGTDKAPDDTISWPQVFIATEGYDDFHLRLSWDEAGNLSPAFAGHPYFRAAKIARGTTRFRPIKNVIVAGARYHLGAPTRHCVDPTGGGNDLLCYRARAASKKRSAKSELWVAHAFGTEELTIGRAKELCLPAQSVE